MPTFQISINDGAWADYDEILPFSIPGVTAADKVEVRSLGPVVTELAMVAPTAVGAIADQVWTVDVPITPVNVLADFTGTAPITVTVQSGTLPTGITMTAGVLSGTPTVATATGTLVFRGTNLAGFADTAFDRSVTPDIATLPVTPQARWHPEASTVTESGGRVVSATDLMGLAGLTEGGAGLGPVVMTDALGRKFWRFDGAQYLNVATALSSNWRDMSVFMVVRHHRGGSHFFGIGNVAGGTAVNTQGSVLDVAVSTAAPLLRSFSGSPTVSPKHFVAGSQLQLIGLASRTTALGGRRMYMNEVAESYTQAPSASSPILGAEIGRYPFSPGSSGSWGTFDLYELVVFSSGLTNANADAVAAALVTSYNIAPVTNQIVLEGDSITAGTPPVTRALSSGMVLATPGLNLIPDGWRVVNMGVSGATVTSLVTRRDVALGWATMALPGQNVVAFEIGANDLPGGTAASHYANVVAWLNTTTTGVLQRGWKVRAMANIAGSGSFIAKVISYRALIRDAQFLIDTGSNVGGPFEGNVSIVSTDLIQYGGATVFEDSADAANTTYYQGDLTHPNVLGAQLRVTGGDTPLYGIASGLAGVAPTAAGATPDQEWVAGTAITPVDVGADFSGTAPITITLQSGTLPTGVTLSAGVLSGTPTTFSLPATLVFRGTNAVGYADTAFEVSVAFETAGYSASYDGGTTGDYFVATTGNDGNPGTVGSPKLTISAAVSAAIAASNPTASIKVRGGTYRETVDPALLFSGRISRYGQEVPVLTGAEPLTGGIPCVVGDAAYLGAIWPSVTKFTIPLSSVPQGPNAAFLNEVGVPLQHVITLNPGAEFPLQYGISGQWLTADETVRTFVSGSNYRINGYRLASLTSTLTEAQIEACEIFIHYKPNVYTRLPVLSYDTGTSTINIPVGAGTYYYETTASKDNFALINCLPKMSAGTWGYRVSGADLILYVWPNDAGNLAAGITYTAREAGFREMKNSTIEGFEIRQFATDQDGTAGMAPISFGMGFDKKAGSTARYNLIESIYASEAAYGAIVSRNSDNAVVEFNTLRDIYGYSGVYLFGGSTNQTSGTFIDPATWDGGKRCLIRRNRFERVARNAILTYGQERVAIVGNVVTSAGRSDHANKLDIKAMCWAPLVMSNRLEGAGGYMPWQDCSGIAVVGNLFTPSNSPSDARAMYDQNRSEVRDPSTLFWNSVPGSDYDGTAYVFNNHIFPDETLPNATTNAVGLSFGHVFHPLHVIVGKNNVSTSETIDPAYIVSWENNITTLGTPLAGTGNQATTHAAEYADVLKGDFTLLPGALTRSKAGVSCASEITMMKARYTQVPSGEFDVDVNGDTVNWVTPHVGAAAAFEYDQVMPPLWNIKPTLTGSPTVGDTLGLTDGQITAFPYPTVSYQMQRSLDGVTWTDIAGATTRPYTVLVGDDGYRVRWRADPGNGGKVEYIEAADPVALTYPIADPVVIASNTAVRSVSSLTPTSVTVSSTGAPLLVIVTYKSLVSTLGTCPITIDGTPMTAIDADQVGDGHTHFAFLASPPVGAALVVTATPDTASYSTRIDVLRVDGMTGLGAEGRAQSTTFVTSGSVNITTGASSSTVLYYFSRINGAAGNDVTMTGCAQILNATTGGTNTNTDRRIGIGFERVASAGPQAAAASWPTAGSYLMKALELLS